MPQGSNLPLVRGLVRTNLSTPALGVVSEATNNFPPESQSDTPSIYCSVNNNFCNTFTVGDPLQQQLMVQSIDPPSSKGGAPTVNVGSSALDLSWNLPNTNAALFSHVKLYPGTYFQETFCTIAAPNVAGSTCVISIEQVDTIVDKTTVWTYGIVGSNGNSNQQWLQQGNQFLLAANQAFALGLDNGQASLRVASDPTTQWTITDLGQGQVAFS